VYAAIDWEVILYLSTIFQPLISASMPLLGQTSDSHEN
jgi:hypothetical protein